MVMEVEFLVEEKTQISPDGFWMKYRPSNQCEVDGWIGRIVGSSEVEYFGFVMLHNEACI